MLVGKAKVLLKKLSFRCAIVVSAEARLSLETQSGALHLSKWNATPMGDVDESDRFGSRYSFQNDGGRN